MQKLYCYADETGQDTKGRFFLVALVLTGQERDVLRLALGQIEKRSGKAAKKWRTAPVRQKTAYIQELLENSGFRGKILYTTFSSATNYLDATIDAIASALAKKAGRNTKATIIIDSLGKREGKAVGTGLRKRNVRIEKVRGLPHKRDEFIRLADAIAGFVRDALEGAPYAHPLYQEAVRLAVIERL